MSKEKQLMEYMVQDMVEIIAEVRSIEYDEAMSILYNSLIYEKIMDPETGLYTESPAYVYDLLNDELKFGKIVQAEQ